MTTTLEQQQIRSLFEHHLAGRRSSSGIRLPYAVHSTMTKHPAYQSTCAKAYGSATPDAARVG